MPYDHESLEEMLTTTYVAERLHVTTETVRNWIEAGLLRGIRINRHWRIPRSSVERLIALKNPHPEGDGDPADEKRRPQKRRRPARKPWPPTPGDDAA